MSNSAEINLYELSADQLSFLFKQYDMAPQTGSPLGDCAELEPEQIVQDAPPSEAIQCLAQPERVLAVATWPPDDAPARWYYGRFDQPYLAQHEVTESGRHLIVWPVSYTDVAEVVADPISGYADEVAAGEFKLTTNQDGMQLLAALCDAMQEQEMLGYLQRSTPDDTALNHAWLTQALEKSLTADDMRWCGARFSHLSPKAFNPVSDSIQPTIDRFLQDHLLRSEDDGYRPTPPLAAICNRWNSTDAFSAVTERRLGADRVWDWQHQAFLHAAGGMFQFEFTDISKEGYAVSISETGTAEILERIAALTAHVVVSQPATPDALKVENNSCRSCGAELRPGNSFCTQCGTPVAQEQNQAADPTTVPVRKQSCSNCGNVLKANTKFCPQCGEKVIAEVSEV